jgi:cytochrome oxidase Cu insertion factor (SCO1/SenC/PrrC family)
MLRRAELALALLVGLGAAPGAAAAHEAVSLEEEFVKGVFSPNFVPPPPGTYELPAVKRVAGFVLRDSTGRTVDTQQITAGKVAVVSFIYTACPERLGCPLASLALQALQGRLTSEGVS